MHRVVYIPGDGIGPEIIAASRRVVDASGVKIEWIAADAGQCAIEKHGMPIPQVTLDSIRSAHATLKGPFTNLPTGFPSPNQTLRIELELFGNLRLAKSFQGVKAVFKDIDLVVLRECTEGSFAGLEHKINQDSAIAIRPTTRAACERIIRFAFNFAAKNDRKKVTVALKANLLKLTDGMFLKAGQDVSGEYPGIQFQQVNIDALAMDLVRKPQEFDVMVMPNEYGDIIADLAGGLIGSLGLCPGGNFGEDLAVFESAHGSAPKYAGQNKINPTAMILSGAMMLKYLKETEAAGAIEKAVRKVIADGKAVTYDLGGTATTSEMTDAIIAELQS